MEDTVLFAAAEALISRELGVDTVCHSGCDSCFLYGNSYIEVLPTERIDEQEPPMFNIRWDTSERPSDVCVFSVKQGLDWDFYVVRSSVITSCSGWQPCVSLPLVEPICIHTKIGGIKQAVNMACNI